MSMDDEWVATFPGCTPAQARMVRMGGVAWLRLLAATRAHRKAQDAFNDAMERDGMERATADPARLEAITRAWHGLEAILDAFDRVTGPQGFLVLPPTEVAMTVDGAREAFDLPPIGGPEGSALASPETQAEVASIPLCPGAFDVDASNNVILQAFEPITLPPGTYSREELACALSALGMRMVEP